VPRPQDMIGDLERISGRSADAWIDALRAAGLGDAAHSERRAWLRQQGLHGNHAGAVLWWAKNGAAIEAGGGELIDRQYAGAKAALRPVYDRVAAAITALGEDVERGARGTYVSFGRPKQFALVQPSTRTRVDVGLRLPGAEPTERLLDAGSFGSGNITHRVALAAPEDVDAELEGWLRAAYEARG
jgi:predicted transport protein